MSIGRNFDRRGFLRTSVGSGAAAWMLGSRGIWGGGAIAADSSAASGLTFERFRDLHKELAPEEGEPMQTIPWKVATNEARKLAADEKKPLFMLSRSGHPLGCT
ncbi:MAG: hypothetical protein WD066_13950 [Planctomycetaceae bacterium]